MAAMARETDRQALIVRAHVMHWQLLLAGWVSHFRWSYIKDSTMKKLDRDVCQNILEKSPSDERLKIEMGSRPKVWEAMVDCLHAATASLEERSYGPLDPMTPAYDGPNSNIIVKHSDSLLQDLQRIDNLVAIARNVVSAGDKVQNLAAQVGFDREVFQLTHLCIKITARGYDGDGNNAEEDRWQHVINGFKKVLITCLQFVNNLSINNERLRLLLWVELFDSAADLQHAPSNRNGESAEPFGATSDEWLAAATARISEAQGIDATPSGSAASLANMQAHLQNWAAGGHRGPKAAMAAYLIFVETKRDKATKDLAAKGIHEPSAILEELQQQWKAMSQEEQAEWVVQYKDRIAQYESHIEIFANGSSSRALSNSTETASTIDTPPVQSPVVGTDDNIAAAATPDPNSAAASTTAVALATATEHMTEHQEHPADVNNSSQPDALAADQNKRAALPFSSVEGNKMESAWEGKSRLAEGKLQLMKRLENAPKPASVSSPPPGHPPGELPPAPPEEAMQHGAAHHAVGSDEEDDLDDEEEYEEDYDEDEDLSEEDDEDGEDDGEDDESSDDDYAIPGEDGRGLLTDVPLILGPNEIEVLPMFIMSGLVPDTDDTGEQAAPPVKTIDGKTPMNMHTIRCHLLLAQENGRNLLRELLIFVAAWDLREEELYFKFMFKITEAILLNGLMPFAYGAFKESKDIISPAQAVIMKLLTKIFHSQAHLSPSSRYNNPRSSYNVTASGQPVRYDVAIVRYLFAEFRRSIIPQICSLIFLQGQIRRHCAAVEDFPLNLWDMERMYEGVYQYLEFFAILTDREEWKQHMAQWEVVSELVTLLRELEVAIPKNRAHPPPPPPPQATQPPPPPPPPGPGAALRADDNAKQSPSSAPVAVERPFDVDDAFAAPPINPPSADEPSATPYPSPPLHDEPADFEWRNLKKLCVLVLSSLVWKNPTLQDQLRKHGGIPVLLACCADKDEHNPFIVQHAIMCLRFALEGNDENTALVRHIAAAHANKPGTAGTDDNDDDDNAAPRGAYDPDLGALAVPDEILDPHGYETFMDVKGQVGLRRKDSSSQQAAATPSQTSSPLPPVTALAGWTPVAVPGPGSAPSQASTLGPTDGLASGSNIAVSHGGKKTGLLEAIGGLPDFWMGGGGRSSGSSSGRGGTA